MEEDNLLVEEMTNQLDAQQAVVNKLKTEMRDLEESLEMKAASAEAGRQKAERATASLQREMGQMVQAGRKHAALIAKWWLWGLLSGWLLSVIISVLISPVLGFIVVIPIIALFLLGGYFSSFTEMKMDLATLKKKKREAAGGGGGRRGGSIGRSGSDAVEMETEEVIGQLLGQSPEEVLGESVRRQGGGGAVGGGGGGWGVISLVGATARGVYHTGAAVAGVTKWMLGYGYGGGEEYENGGSKRD